MHLTVLFTHGLCERRAAFVATVQALLAKAEGGGGCVPAGVSITLLLEPEVDLHAFPPTTSDGSTTPDEESADDAGSTPLHDAAGYGDTDKVVLFLDTAEGRAMVDVQDSVRHFNLFTRTQLCYAGASVLVVLLFFPFVKLSSLHTVTGGIVTV